VRIGLMVKIKARLRDAGAYSGVPRQVARQSHRPLSADAAKIWPWVPATTRARCRPTEDLTQANRHARRPLVEP
jgi:hypothetical protein